MAEGGREQTFTKENRNFYRCSSLILDLGADVLREVFRTYYHPNDLKSYLTANYNLINSWRFITDDQFYIIYPQNAAKDDSTFDITLLYTLIRNLSADPGKTAWTNPNPADTSAEADVARIRDTRNTLFAHADSTEMSDSEFTNTTDLLETVYVRIITSLCSPAFTPRLTTLDIQKRIEQIKQESLDPRTIDAILDAIKADLAVMKSTTASVQRSVDELKESRKEEKLYRRNLHKSVNSLTEDVKDIKKNVEDIGDMKQDMKCLTDDMKDLTKDVKTLLQQNGSARDKGAASTKRTANDCRSATNVNQTETSSDSSSDDAGSSDDDDRNAEDNSTQENQSLDERMRDYQVELAEDAVQGKNTIILADTGSGKTWVALYVAKRHLQSRQYGNRKIVFMARTTTLIRQQRDRFRKYLSEYQTELLTGESEFSTQLGQMLRSYEIFCMTPQVLVNNIDEGGVSLEDFSLLILDECHHTKHNEPYNRLMRKYIALKLNAVDNRLPQVIGLTASVGVGKKSKVDQDAVDYIINICANLDAHSISTVEKNKEEIRKYVNLPKEERIHMVERPSDPCKTELTQAVRWIEKKLDDCVLFEPCLEDILHAPPSDKASLEHMQWSRKLWDIAVQKVVDSRTQRFVVTCATYLGAFNEALEINFLMGIRDVIKFFSKRFQEEGHQQHKLSVEETELFDKLKDIQRSLKDMSRSMENQNPNLQLLKDTLRRMLQEKGQDSRAMIFVKSRATCIALAEDLARSLMDMGVGAHQLIGKGNRNFEEGMTEAEQVETMKKFHTGEYKVLVATSIGAEGIDVPECNIVLRYNFAGDEISKIQMAGRSRKKGGTAVVLGDAKTMRTETISTHKAAMMYRAIEEIKRMRPEELKLKVERFQKDDYTSETLRKYARMVKEQRKEKVDFDLSCGRCGTFVVGGGNIRVMKKVHYIVIDPTFKDRFELKPHRKPLMVEGLHKKFKMHCLKCPQDWGIVFEYQGIHIRTLKLKSLKVKSLKTGKSDRYKQWIDVPHKVDEIELTDLVSLIDD